MAKTFCCCCCALSVPSQISISCKNRSRVQLPTPFTWCENTIFCSFCVFKALQCLYMIYKYMNTYPCNIILALYLHFRNEFHFSDVHRAMYRSGSRAK